MVERERRAHQRKLVSTGVSFGDDDSATLRGWLHDISRGGCFVATPSLFTFGEEIEIDFTLPYPRQRVHGKARVVWLREKNDKDMPAGMGMAFVDVNADALVAIDKLASGAKLSRPKTVIGIAPPAVGSSPSYSDVKIQLPTAEELAKPLPPPPPKEPEREPSLELSVDPDPSIPPPPPLPPPLPARDPALPPEPVIEIAPRASEPAPKKTGKEKWLIGGAAVVSVGGLVALGVVYSHTTRSSVVVDAATSATATASASATPTEVVSTTASAAPSMTIASPIPSTSTTTSVVDAGSHDAGVHDAGVDGGKKKPKPKPKHR